MRSRLTDTTHHRPIQGQSSTCALQTKCVTTKILRSCEDMLKILLYNFELLRSNHRESGSLCGMLNTTAVQVSTCVVFLQQKKISKLVCLISHIPVSYQKQPATICPMQLILLGRAGQHKNHFFLGHGINQYLSTHREVIYLDIPIVVTGM